ncbi:MAG TPA: hypothetical protein VFW73_08935 [Lacipirellulaceae bacterium]|nr:hypothetical protein [Lacipirellulaceae bacterium]
MQSVPQICNLMRRPQFSLRTLLGLAAAVCLILGIWHMVTVYGQFVEALPAPAGEPVVVAGRAIRVFGPPELEYHFRLTGDLAADEIFGFYAMPYRAKRSWLCVYEIRAVIISDLLPIPRQLPARHVFGRR